MHPETVGSDAPVRLTNFVAAGGCAAKVDKATLEHLLTGMRAVRHPSVLVGSETCDDAGVVALTDDIALVQTIDFFPPMVDSPRGFGRVAAANALSDIYAMGARPVSAVSVYALPTNLPPGVPAEILDGAQDVLETADTPLVGGHTIRDTEIKFGLSVVGVVHPARIVTNAGARPGDALVLTKSLGSGFLCTALKRGELDPATEDRVMAVMTSLNRAASEAMVEIGVHAATDVTGFGLLGHGCGMARASGVTLRIDASEVPWIEGLAPYATSPNVCGGLTRNLAYAERNVRWEGIDEVVRRVLADPQTSGGLLIAVPEALLADLLGALDRRGVGTRAVIGEVVPREEAAVVVH